VHICVYFYPVLYNHSSYFLMPTVYSSTVAPQPAVHSFAPSLPAPGRFARSGWPAMVGLLLLCVALFSTAYAQPRPRARPTSVNLAIRFVKLGNTLREAKQYTQAIGYLQRALATLTKAGDRYWAAAAYENLGLISRDLAEEKAANEYLTKALNGYKSVNANLSARVVQQVLTGVTAPEADQEIYGGIDIGSRGIKMSVVSLRFSADGKPTLVILKSDTKNTAALDGTPEAFAKTSVAVKGYLDSLLVGRKIPRDRVFVVGSSGLKNELERPEKAGKLAELTQLLKTDLATVWTEPIPFIDAAKEAELTVRGTLPEAEWRRTSTIDIGSGNTKGGYFRPDGGFEYVAFLGTGSLANYLKENKQPADSAQTIYTNEFRTVVSEGMARKPEFQKRKRTYLLGGIVYALVSYLHPDQANRELVSFSYKDALRFQALAISNYDALINPDLSRIEREADLKKAQSELRSVQKIFTREQVIAGATLLRGIMAECQGGMPGEKEFIFHRQGVIGWISGYVEQARAASFVRTKDQ
jgi:Tetratricopeptide repeat